MREYVIMTDSCCDLPAGLARELDLTVLPLSVMLDGKEYRNYLDGRELDPQKFYGQIRAGSMGTTSAISVGTFRDAMEPVLREGKDILCIAFSSALSTTYQSAAIAAGELSGQYPGAKILVVDSRAASLGQGLLVTLAARRKQAGKSLE